MDKVLRHNGVVGVSKNTHQVSGLRCLLEGGEQFFLGASLLKLNGKFDHGDIGGWDTNGHTGEDTVQFGDDLADGLGGTGGGGDEVGNGGTKNGRENRWDTGERVSSRLG